MTSYNRVIEEHLQKASSWWKWQLFVRRSAALAAMLSCCLLLLGVAMLQGWLTDGTAAAVIFFTTVFFAAICWFLVAVFTADKRLGRDWQAASLEKSYQPLMDRVNTLVYLQNKNDPASGAYRQAIERQTRQLLKVAPRTVRFSWFRTWLYLAGSIALLAANIGFYSYCQPWQRLGVASDPTLHEEDLQRAELKIPETTQLADSEPFAAEDRGPWGEVRISEPGRDLRIVLSEVVPLQIEAACNEPIQRVAWFSTVSGHDEVMHPLPAPQDPRYNVFRAEIWPEALALEEWDVVSYYAQATCDTGRQYKSDTYFIEILPLSEQLDALPESAYRALEDMTGMLQLQQEVIRQTARLAEQPTGTDYQQRSDALAAEEANLAEAARHLAADLQNRSPSEELADALERAETWFDEAQQSLQQQAFSEARNSQQEALSGMVAARKELYKSVRETPGRWDRSTSQLAGTKGLRKKDNEEGQPPEAGPLPDKVKELQKKQEHLADAQEAVKQLQKKQADLTRQAAASDVDELPQLAKQQQSLQRGLQRLIKERPQDFEGIEAEAERLEKQMESTAKAMDLAQENAQRMATASREQLDQLAKDLEQSQAAQQAQQQLEQAQTLEQWLDQSIDDLASFEKQPPTPQQVQQLGEQTRDLLDEIKKSDCAKSVSDQQFQKLRGLCDKMCQGGKPGGNSGGAASGGSSAGESSSGQSAAADLKQGLQDIADSMSAARQQAQDRMNDQQLAGELNDRQQQRDELQKARNFVRDSLLEQRTIERVANPQKPDSLSQLADRQKQLNEKLDNFMKEQPAGFDELPGECAGAKSAMNRTEQALRAGQQHARQQAGQAADALQQLDNALEGIQQRNDLADAYRMKQMLDQQIDQLQALESDPRAGEGDRGRQIARNSQEVVSGLRQLALRPGGQSALGEQTQRALDRDNTRRIDSAAEQLARAENAEQAQASAKSLRAGLEQVSQAFEEDRPDNLARRQQPQSPAASSLKPSGQQAIARGLRQLESAARRQEQSQQQQSGQQPKSAGQQAGEQLRREALKNLSDGIAAEYGHNEHSDEFLQRLAGDLEEPEFEVDRATIQRLLQQIQSLRREIEPEADSEAEQAHVLHIDPAQFPADYRESIERYFETLSKQPGR